MLFNSVTFLTYLLLVVGVYWLLPVQRLRMWWVFLMSLLFYGFWRFEFLPLMAFTTFVDYWAALKISRTADQVNRRRFLIGAITINLGLLFVFKYLLFFTNSAISLAGLAGIQADPITWNLILPLGISFYTFHSISYTVDVYRGFIPAEKDYLRFGCYVTFFPQLVAGPILRAVEVIPQLVKEHKPQLKNFIAGFWRISMGLFLKVVLADNLAPLVDDGFNTDTASLSAWDVWTLAFLFGFQIYFDFSAYSHIAIGCALLMGIHFPENFNFPYLSRSPREFWKRWHISLSSWIRDYLYLPLTGQPVADKSTGGLPTEVKDAKHSSNETKALFLTWAIMGLWHGANWTFALWGIYHALCIWLYRAARKLPWPSGFYSPVITWGVTLALMMLSWIPFRAADLPQALSMWARLIDPSAYLWLGLKENNYLIAVLMLLSCLFSYWVSQKRLVWQADFPVSYRVARFASLGSIVLMVLVFLRPIKQFIYFQF